MLSKIGKAIKNPERILPYFLMLARRWYQVKRVEKDGKVFYKYKGDLYPDYLKKGNAMSWIVDKAEQYCQGKGVDVGAGEWPFPGAIPIQNEEHQSAYKLDKFSDGSLDYVFSSHCLEHLDKWEDALRLWIRKLRTGGILFLYLPHQSMPLWRKGGPWIFDAHKWVPTYNIILKFLIENGMKIIEYNPEKDEYWSFHIVAKRIKGKIHPRPSRRRCGGSGQKNLTRELSKKGLINQVIQHQSIDQKGGNNVRNLRFLC